MTISKSRALMLGASAALTLASLAGCASHSADTTVPAGMKTAVPMTASQQQALDQAAAARAAKRNGQ